MEVRLSSSHIRVSPIVMESWEGSPGVMCVCKDSWIVS